MPLTTRLILDCTTNFFLYKNEHFPLHKIFEVLITFLLQTVPLTSLYESSTTKPVEAPRTSLTQIGSNSDKTSNLYSNVPSVQQDNSVKGKLSKQSVTTDFSRKSTANFILSTVDQKQIKKVSRLALLAHPHSAKRSEAKVELKTFLIIVALLMLMFSSPCEQQSVELDNSDETRLYMAYVVTNNGTSTWIECTGTFISRSSLNHICVDVGVMRLNGVCLK